MATRHLKQKSSRQGQILRLILSAGLAAATSFGAPSTLWAQSEKEEVPKTVALPNEDVLGEFVVTGTVEEHIPKIGILPSLSPALEDVIVRSVVRRDLELSGMFRVMGDDVAPPGTYGFNDPVDVGAWQSLGAEAVVKVAARNHESGRIEVLGLAYFPSSGPKPVYKTKLLVDKANARKTAHQITDDLLGALTGRPGGFSSRLAFTGEWGRNLRIFAADADGYGLTPQTDEKDTSMGASFGPDGQLYFSRSRSYSPYRLHKMDPTKPGSTSAAIPVEFKSSIYSSAFSKDKTKLALAVSEKGRSSIYEGSADGQGMKRVSKNELATHPAYSPEGHLAWIGGSEDQGSQRVYVDGKAVSPAGFTASAPTFCDTEDGVFLIYSVAVGLGQHDIVMSRPNGQGLTRLTQDQGSNTYPACSPDGRLLAFFSTRKSGKGLYVLSLKRFTTKKVLGTVGEGLRWEALPRDELTRPIPEGEVVPPFGTRAPTQTSLAPACGLAPDPK